MPIIFVEIKLILLRKLRFCDIFVKKGMEYYSTIIQKNVDVTKLSREDCVDCIDVIIRANMSLMKDRPLGQRQTIATSICVLEAAKKYIMEK